MSAADTPNMQTLLIYALCSAWSLYNCGKKKGPKSSFPWISESNVHCLKNIPQLLTATLARTVHFHCISCKKKNLKETPELFSRDLVMNLSIREGFLFLPPHLVIERSREWSLGNSLKATFPNGLATNLLTTKLWAKLSKELTSHLAQD